MQMGAKMMKFYANGCINHKIRCELVQKSWILMQMDAIIIQKCLNVAKLIPESPCIFRVKIHYIANFSSWRGIGPNEYRNRVPKMSTKNRQNSHQKSYAALCVLNPCFRVCIGPLRIDPFFTLFDPFLTIFYDFWCILTNFWRVLMKFWRFLMSFWRFLLSFG